MCRRLRSASPSALATAYLGGLKAVFARHLADPTAEEHLYAVSALAEKISGALG